MEQAQQGSLVSMIMMLVLMFVVFYFFLIRPQRKKEKKLQNMIANLKVGDVVASIGGIHGKIVRIKDDVFVLESGIGVTKSYITLDRSAIARLSRKARLKQVKWLLSPTMRQKARQKLNNLIGFVICV